MKEPWRCAVCCMQLSECCHLTVNVTDCCSESSRENIDEVISSIDSLSTMLSNKCLQLAENVWVLCSRFTSLYQASYVLHWFDGMFPQKERYFQTIGDVVWIICPQNPLKWAWLSAFKLKCQNVKIALSSKYKSDQAETSRQSSNHKLHCGWSAQTTQQIQHQWWPPSWKSLCYYNSPAGGLFFLFFWGDHESRGFCDNSQPVLRQFS